MPFEEQETTIFEDVFLITSTSKALLINFGDDQFWIPRSQIVQIKFGKDLNDEASGNQVKEIELIELPTWLCDDKGLI